MCREIKALGKLLPFLREQSRESVMRAIRKAGKFARFANGLTPWRLAIATNACIIATQLDTFAKCDYNSLRHSCIIVCPILPTAIPAPKQTSMLRKPQALAGKIVIDCNNRAILGLDIPDCTLLAMASCRDTFHPNSHNDSALGRH